MESSTRDKEETNSQCEQSTKDKEEANSQCEPSTDKEEANYQCDPLTTLKEFLTWRYIPTEHPFRPNPLLKGLRKSPHLGEVILIHDMKGGYLDDKFIHGNDNTEAFRFYHWHLIDWFVYFSHHLITIPPPAWIHVGHTNGVPVLGTFITEWDEGQKILEEILATDDSIGIAVDQLLLMCKWLRFDGWFINIESKVRKELIPRLVQFLKLLYQGGILVVWYDSVITNGELKWQNELNELNYPFLSALYKSDETYPRGRIFLNYTWKPEQLDKSHAFATNKDFPVEIVHVGVDVFGRGCLGDGGMNCDVALQEIWRRPPLSVGLFAPGWVYETQETSKDNDIFFQNLNGRTMEFWGRIEEFLGGPRSLQQLIRTEFSLGQGERWFRHGALESDNSKKNDMKQQAIMPHFYPSTNAAYSISFDRSTAFSGTNCLKVEVRSLDPVIVPLFSIWRGSDELEKMQVVTRWPKDGPGPDDRVLAMVLKVRNQEVDVEESPEIRQKRRKGETAPDDDLYRITVIGLCESPDQIGKAIYDKIRIHCVDQERMDQMCPVPPDHIQSLKFPDSEAHTSPELEPFWTLHQLRGFGTPGALMPGRAMVYEMGILIWDLRHRPSAAAALDRFTCEPKHPLCLNVGGFSMRWNNEQKRDGHLRPYIPVEN